MLQAKKIIIFLLSAVVLLSCVCIPASASAGYPFTIPYSQPQVTDHSCYLEVLIRDYSGSYSVMVVNVESIQNSSENTAFTVDIKEKSLTITALGDEPLGDSLPEYISIGCIFTSGAHNFYMAEYGADGLASWTLDYTGSAYTSHIENIHVYGAQLRGTPYSSTTFAVLYSDTANSFQELQRIYNSIQSLGSESSAIKEYVSSIYYSNIRIEEKLNLINKYLGTLSTDIIQNQDENTDKITQNDDENTQAIIDNQNQIQENEKTEIENSGGSAADNAAGSIPNKSQGFMDSIKSFVSTMSTTSTVCSLTFPAIKIPGIEGLFPETVLSDEMEITFSDAIRMIPEAIMKIIQAVTTIGLIVYCFKELYSTISEALTRKKDSNE